MQSEIHWHNKIPEKQPIFTNFITEELKNYLSEVLRQPYNKNHKVFSCTTTWRDIIMADDLGYGDVVKEYLFDLKQDPAEKNNLVTERKEDVQKLKILLKNWEQEVKHKRWQLTGFSSDNITKDFGR